MFSAATLSRLLNALPHWRRLIAVCLLTVLLHLLAIGWTNRHLRVAASTADDIQVLRAQLYAPPPPPPPPSVPTVAPPARKKPAAMRPKAMPPTVTPVASFIPTRTAAPIFTPISATSAVTEDPESSWVQQDVAADASPASQSASTRTGARLRVDPPPTAELKYDVQALRNGDIVYGNGKIAWDFSGGRYTVRGEAGILFFTLLSFGSAGITDEFGIAPVLYNEKPFRKAEMATHFSRERNLISFSASTLSYPIQGGEQDRASIIWQLAGIGRGDTGKFMPNAVFPMFVAGVRDGEPWNLHVIGEEEIEVGIGTLTAWHVVRVPRPGSYEEKLDIWLAPQQHWYPVRLRYTYSNGDYLDMKASSIKPDSSR